MAPAGPRDVATGDAAARRQPADATPGPESLSCSFRPGRGEGISTPGPISELQRGSVPIPRTDWVGDASTSQYARKVTSSGRRLNPLPLPGQD